MQLRSSPQFTFKQHLCMIICQSFRAFISTIHLKLPSLRRAGTFLFLEFRGAIFTLSANSKQVKVAKYSLVVKWELI